MNSLSPFTVAWDAWRATRGGPAAILARQQARLADLTAFARSHSRFYAAHYRNLPVAITDVRQLPPVTKPKLMAHFDDWFTDPAVTRADVEAFVADPGRIGQLYRDRYPVFTTSGTTGVPAILVQDQRALAVNTGVGYVRGLLSWLTPGLLCSMLRQHGRSAAIVATGGHFGALALIEWRHRTHPWAARITRAFSVLAPLSELVRDLNAFQPAILAGYPTAIALLAFEQAAGRLQITPALISTLGECLTPALRRQIETTFACQVRDCYGSSEVQVIAFECARGTLHVNADWVILEPVDAAYQPVPSGQASQTVLLTNLANHVQPIIRYDLGDRVIVCPDPCPCGSPLPAIQVEGRTDEILAFQTPGGQTIHLLPMALATVIEETPGIERFQAIQTAPDQLTVRLQATGDTEAVWMAVRRRVQAYLASQGLTTVAVERADELPAPNPRSGKFRHIWAELRVQELAPVR